MPFLIHDLYTYFFIRSFTHHRSRHDISFINHWPFLNRNYIHNCLRDSEILFLTIVRFINYNLFINNVGYCIGCCK